MMSKPEYNVLTHIKTADFVKTLPPVQREIVECWKGSDRWYIYKGEIPPKWIKAVERTGA
jgi:hypothetical protein